jgi:hypothetical protein
MFDGRNISTRFASVGGRDIRMSALPLALSILNNQKKKKGMNDEKIGLKFPGGGTVCFIQDFHL